MELNDIKYCGRRLLTLFRDKQFAEHGNHGCMCSKCEADMIAAIERLLKEGTFLIERTATGRHIDLTATRPQLAADIADSVTMTDFSSE